MISRSFELQQILILDAYKDLEDVFFRNISYGNSERISSTNHHLWCFKWWFVIRLMIILSNTFKECFLMRSKQLVKADILESKKAISLLQLYIHEYKFVISETKRVDRGDQRLLDFEDALMTLETTLKDESKNLAELKVELSQCVNSSHESLSSYSSFFGQKFHDFFLFFIDFWSWLVSFVPFHGIVFLSYIFFFLTVLMCFRKMMK